MPSYNLTQQQVDICTTWLFEPGGYMDAAVDSAGQSARQALAADPGLDVYSWIAASQPHPSTIASDWSDCAMVWWIRDKDQVNITPPTRPPETPDWVATLQSWDVEINAGFGRTGIADRNQQSIQFYDEAGLQAGSMPAGSHLAQQQQLITKVLGVLT